MSNIKAVVLNFDGVITDGTVLIGEKGEEFKRYSHFDIAGIFKAKKLGILFAILTSENSQITDMFAKKMDITNVYKFSKEKEKTIQDFASQNNLSIDQVCYIGDDKNDIPAMKICGWCACPSNASSDVKKVANYVSVRAGGNGAIRDIIEKLFFSN